jgi:hypothetical protein
MYCAKSGHIASDCRLAKENKKQRDTRARAAATDNATESTPTATITEVAESENN